MRYLIMLEPLESGFAVQVPDLAITTTACDIESAKQAARLAIRINLDAYAEENLPVPQPQEITHHLANPEFQDHLFTYVEVPLAKGIN